MPTWFIFAVLSLFVLAASEFSQKVSLTQKIAISAITNNFVVWFLQGVLALLFALLFTQFTFVFSFVSITKLLIVAVVYFLGGTFFYTSFKGNSPSLSIILGSISVLISTILGVIFLQEQFTIIKFLAIVLILMAIIIVNYNVKEKLTRYNLFALLGGVLSGLAFTIDKSFAIQISPIMYVSLLSFSVAFVSLFLKHSLILNQLKAFKFKNYLPMISASVFGTFFNFFTFSAYVKGGNVGVVDAMNNCAVFIVILLEIVILKDRTNLFKKVIGSLIVVSAITVLTLS